MKVTGVDYQYTINSKVNNIYEERNCNLKRWYAGFASSGSWERIRKDGGQAQS